MSVCINPSCPQPNDPANLNHQVCCNCGSQLLLQGRYQVMRLLSETSGFGKVYEAYQGAKPKILKILKPKHNNDPRIVELFKQEAEVLMTLDHPGIPKVEQDGYFQFLPRDSSDSLHCLMMEKIDGPNLRQWMEQQGNNPISERQGIQWLKQLAEVLHLVHQENYFHRDIKPENIMIRPSGQLVLIDFGAAREVTYTYLEKLGETAGITKISSAGYTPPEQEKGYAVPQSDFYALGRTFVYLLTAKEITDSDIYNPLTDEFTWQNYTNQISPELIELIDKLIAPKAIDRPEDTQEILNILQQFDSRRSTSHLSTLPETVPENQEQKTLLTGRTTVIQGTPHSWQEKGLWSGIIFIILGLGGYGIWQGSKSFRPTSIIQLQETPQLAGHGGTVNDLVFSHDSQNLFSGGADTTLKMWNAQTGQLIKTFAGEEGHSSYINEIIITSDGYHLISAGADKKIKVWSLNDPKKNQPKTLIGHSNFINALALSVDGKQLISAAKKIRIWDLESGSLLTTLLGHENFINSLVVLSDDKTLISADADGMIKIWDFKNSTLTFTLQGHEKPINALVTTPDGDFLISASADQTIKVWNLETYQLVQTLTGHKNPVQDLSIHPDGNILVSSSTDKTIKFWNLKTGEILYTFEDYPYQIDDFEVSPDWQKLATGSGNQTITLWNLKINHRSN